MYGGLNEKKLNKNICIYRIEYKYSSGNVKVFFFYNHRHVQRLRYIDFLVSFVIAPKYA